MKIYSLAADKPIVKSYSLNEDDVLVKSSYPFIYEVTSTEHDCDNIEAFEHIIQKSALAQHCLLKGVLSTSLLHQSRAGATDPDDLTEWICLDLDGVSGFATPDDFLAATGLGDVDYVLQWSSSMGIEAQGGLRCHIFLMLDQPIHPATLKLWLQTLNLSSAVLSSQCSLTKTFNALRWPLDITTCQNDKLVYVTTPLFGPGLIDPIPLNSRISLVKKAKRRLSSITSLQSPIAIRDLVILKVAELRAGASLPKRKKTSFKFFSGTEYLENPDPCQLTGKRCERGFVYMNLNGGDSWGYYHPEDNPTFIYNFKGEPTYRTQDLLPQYWEKECKRVKDFKPNSAGDIYLVFREMSTATYYNGICNETTGILTLSRASGKEQLKDFMKSRGQPFYDVIPDWLVIFDPSSTKILAPEKKLVNIYRPSQYEAQAVTPVHVPPSLCHHVISSALGGDPATVEHFYNWLSVIVQSKSRTMTAWVLQGVSGTGKGLVFHGIIKPLLGDSNVTMRRMDEIESEFTSYMENRLVVFVDEAETGRSLFHSKITAKLKNLITEPTVSVRKMYQEAASVKNHTNMIFASNKPDPVELDAFDRRFNVGFFQRQRLMSLSHPSEPFTNLEATELLSAELSAMMNYLKTRKADANLAARPIDNQARRDLIETTTTALDSVVQALARGDIRFFFDELADKRPIGFKEANAYSEYLGLVEQIISSLPGALSRDELVAIVSHTTGQAPAPSKFNALLKRHGMMMKPVWHGGRTKRGIEIKWTYDQKWLEQAKKDLLLMKNECTSEIRG